MGRSSGNYFLFSLTPETAGICLFWVASKLYPAKIETKTINGKSLKFQIPGCLFLTRSCMLLWTHLFHPEVNSYSLKSVWPAIFGWSISVWKTTTFAFFQSSGWLSSILHKFTEIVSVTFKFLCFGIQNVCDSYFKILCQSNFFYLFLTSPICWKVTQSAINL